jgi:hypothetical protein
MNKIQIKFNFIIGFVCFVILYSEYKKEQYIYKNGIKTKGIVIDKDRRGIKYEFSINNAYYFGNKSCMTCNKNVGDSVLIFYLSNEPSKNTASLK